MDSIGLDEQDCRRTSSSEGLSSQGYTLDEVFLGSPHNSRSTSPLLGDVCSRVAGLRCPVEVPNMTVGLFMSGLTL